MLYLYFNILFSEKDKVLFIRKQRRKRRINYLFVEKFIIDAGLSYQNLKNYEFPRENFELKALFLELPNNRYSEYVIPIIMDCISLLLIHFGVGT